MRMRQKNVIVSLSEEVVEKLRVYVEEHYVQSLNAVVKEALEHYIAKLGKKKLKKEMEEASRDPMFLAD